MLACVFFTVIALFVLVDCEGECDKCQLDECCTGLVSKTMFCLKLLKEGDDCRIDENTLRCPCGPDLRCENDVCVKSDDNLPNFRPSKVVDDA